MTFTCARNNIRQQRQKAKGSTCSSNLCAPHPWHASKDEWPLFPITTLILGRPFRHGSEIAQASGFSWHNNIVNLLNDLDCSSGNTRFLAVCGVWHLFTKEVAYRPGKTKSRSNGCSWDIFVTHLASLFFAASKAFCLFDAFFVLPGCSISPAQDSSMTCCD